MGVGTLIIFVALLLVATVAAGVLIQTNTSLREKSLQTGNEAQNQVTNAIEVVNIVGHDSDYNRLDEISAIVRLAPGSNPIPLDSMIISLDNHAWSGNYLYKGAGSPIERSGDGYSITSDREYGALGGIEAHYIDGAQWVTNTGFTVIPLDLDFDGSDEKIIVCDTTRSGNPCFGMDSNTYNGRYLVVDLSSAGNQFIPIYNQTMDGTLHVGDAGDSGKPFSNNKTPIGEYGYLSIVGILNPTGMAIGGANSDIIIYTKEAQIGDLDGDRIGDSFVFNGSDLVFDLSQAGNIIIPLGVDLSAGAQTVNINSDINDGSSSYGSIVINGATSRANVVDESVTVYLTPATLNQGYYVAESLHEGPNFMDGVMQAGDVYRIRMVSAGYIYENEKIVLKIIPNTGMTKFVEFYTPEVFDAQDLAMYP